MGSWERKKEAEYERRSSRRSARRSKASLTWNGVPVDMVGLFVHLMVREGRAVLLGTTSDGDVLSVKVYEDGDKESFYIRAKADVKESLADIIDEYSPDSTEAFLEAFTAPKAVEVADNPKDAERTRKKD